MPNMTLSIPDDLHALMKDHPEINWSAVARRALREHAEKWAWLEDTLKHSKLTEEDVWEFDKKIKAGIRKRLEEEGSWPTPTSSSQPSSKKASRGRSSTGSRSKSSSRRTRSKKA